MSHLIRLISLCSLVVITAAGCTVPPRPGIPVSPDAQVVPPDMRAEAYGSSIELVAQNPVVGDNVRAMFGPDWTGGQLAPPGASAYFATGDPPRMVRVDGVNYIAYTGCMPAACETSRVLLLIREGGSEMVARLDDGGFAHYYAYGNVNRDTAQLVADGGLRALRRAGEAS
ncbi:MAG TPA: hypothetical protein VF238_06965 [Methylomirabilota bacterium]